MSTAKTKKIFFWALLSAMLLTLVFIFTNSLRPPEESMEQSDAVGGFFAFIFSPDKPLGKFVQDHIRKIGHFGEYGILGAEVAAFVMFYLQKRREKALLSAPFAMCVAVVDETLQYLSGRGPAISDVWIDLGGFVSGSLLCYGIIMLVLRVRAAKAARSGGTEGENG